jgi:CRP-like cAMP-binding protein
MELQHILELFQLRPESWQDIQGAFTLREYRRNQVVFREGDTPDRFYFIKSGRNCSALT